MRIIPVTPSFGWEGFSQRGDLVIGEAELDYSSTKYNLVSLFEFENGKLKKEVDYFCAPFEAEAWRAQWVEKI